MRNRPYRSVQSIKMPYVKLSRLYSKMFAFQIVSVRPKRLLTLVAKTLKMMARHRGISAPNQANRPIFKKLSRRPTKGKHPVPTKIAHS